MKTFAWMIGFGVALSLGMQNVSHASNAGPARTLKTLTQTAWGGDIFSCGRDEPCDD